MNPALRAATQASNACPPSPETLSAAYAHFDASKASPHPLDGLPELLRLAELFPNSERLQLLAVRLRDRGCGRAATVEAWRRLADHFPLCHEPLLVLARWLRQTSGPQAARAEIIARLRGHRRLPEPMLLRARAWAEIGDQVRADRSFAALFRAHPDFEPGYTRYAALLRRRDPWRAAAIIQAGLAAAGPRPRLLELTASLATDCADLVGVPRPRRTDPAGVAGWLLPELIQRAGRGRSAPPPLQGGKVVMLTSTLGAGGAERQLINTAIGLSNHASDPVEVWCRSLSDRPNADFFLPPLQAADIPVRIYGAMPKAERVGSDDPDVERWLRFLPPEIVEATLRLVAPLREAAPAVIHLWQDGTILAGALAAILAGVPRIVLSVRSVPPPDRPERDRPEYAPLYQALMRLPGITLVSNSRFAARRYAEWIGLPEHAVRVVHNGLAPLPRRAEQRSLSLAKAFRCDAGRGFTVGSVMRLDANKRPEIWIDCAVRFSSVVEQARFIIIGDGPLLHAAKSYVSACGISSRFLFVGRAADVGFWLGQMDAFLLLSRAEGLPNVLIEAQSLGVPVIATPAGGAPETLLDRETGWVLRDTEAPDLDEAVGRLAALARDRTLHEAMSKRARRFVRASFSIDAMVKGTRDVYHA